MIDWEKEMQRRRFLDVLDMAERMVNEMIEREGPLTLTLSFPASDPGSRTSEPQTERREP